MRVLKNYLLPIALLWLLPLVVNAQIYQPEGINLPGSWNGFTNTNDELTMGNFRASYRALGGGQYVTTLNVQATDGDMAAGDYTMLFTSGPDANTFANKWADAAILIDGFTDLTYNTGADNTITVADGFFYTFIFKDSGYENSSVSVLKTSAEPVAINSVTGIPAENVAENTAVTINVDLNKQKSAEEKVFIRYSIDGFLTSNAVEVTNFTGNTGTVDIPAQPINTKVEFYALTTTLAKTDWSGKIDLATIAIDNNEGSNYSYYYETNIEPANRATTVSVNPNFVWFSIDGATNYDFQLSDNDAFSLLIVDESSLTDTTYSYSSDLAINSTYFWRFKPSTSSDWSQVYTFTTESEITFANIQYPASSAISKGEILTVYGQFTVPGVTDKSGENSTIKAWIGVNSEDTNPSTWNESAWKLASFNTDKVSTDEYSAEIGDDLQIGNHFYAFRYQYKSQDYVFGGIDGFWNGTNSISGKLNVLEIPILVSPLNNTSNFELNGALTWASIDSRIQGFHIQIDDEPTLGSPFVDDAGINAADQSYVIADGTLQHSTKYFWKIRAVYDTTNGGWSETFAFITKQDVPDKTSLIQPNYSDLTESITPTFIWNNTERADTYTLEVSEDQNFGTNVIWIDSIADSQFVVTDSTILKWGSQYYWRVQATNDSGVGAWSDTLSFDTKLKIPMLVSPAEDAINIETSPNLLWRAINGAVSYDLQLSKTSSFSTTIADSSEIVDTVLVAPTLENNTSYYWRVRANYANDVSNWSASQLFTTKNAAPLPPNLLAPLQGAENIGLMPELSWSEVVDADFYELQLSLVEDFSADIIFDSTGITSAELKMDSLTANTRFYWRTRSVNSITGIGDWSQVFSFVTIPTNPANFDGLLPVNGEESLQNPVTFIWQKSERADQYQFQYSKTNDFVFVGDTLVQDTSLVVSDFEEGIKYYWRVRSSNVGGSSDWSTIKHFTMASTDFASPKLNAPANGSYLTATNIEFEWESNKNAVSYKLQLASDNNFSAIIIDSVGLSASTITVQNLEKDRAYFWRVKTLYADGESAWSVIYQFNIQSEESRKPTPLLPANKDESISTPITFSWNSIEGAQSYGIRISKQENFSISIDSSGIMDTTFVVNKLDANTEYFWQVRSSNTTGESNWSQVFSFTTATELPETPELIHPDDSALIKLPVRLGWNKATGAESYELQIATDNLFEFIKIDSLNIESLTIQVNNLQENEKYFWRVRARNNAGVSSWSKIASFTTQISTDIAQDELPNTFTLNQNYPNPFNPSTTISFSLAEAGLVSIKVYNVAGQKVTELINQRKSAGTHQVVWDASNAASGVYYYTMIAGEHIFTKKMTLIK